MLRRSALLGLITALAATTAGTGVAATATPKPTATPANTAFDDARFSFSFSYASNWIPSVQAEGESITFALSEGEVFISAQRDPNPRRLKTRAALADDQISSWKKREGLVFSKLDKVETTLGSVPATRIDGVAKEYDEDFPYKLETWIVERDGRLYVLKFSGLYDSQAPYWDGFQALVKSFKFRESSVKPTATPSPTRTPVPKPSATRAPSDGGTE